ncbi:MAG: hypothetical protein ACLUE1_06405 [Adlercreutzia equolifaciens]
MANTLAAVCAGATSVQGTVNGIGERVGNTDLLTVIADLELKMDARVWGHSLTQLYVRGPVRGRALQRVGAGAPSLHRLFGLRPQGWPARERHCAVPAAYEHVSPAAVGNASRTVVSELAGKARCSRRREASASIWKRPAWTCRRCSTTSRRARRPASPTRWPTARWAFCSCAT